MACTTVRLASIYGNPCSPWANFQTATLYRASAFRTRLPYQPIYGRVRAVFDPLPCWLAWLPCCVSMVSIKPHRTGFVKFFTATNTDQNRKNTGKKNEQEGADGLAETGPPPLIVNPSQHDPKNQNFTNLTAPLRCCKPSRAFTNPLTPPYQGITLRL